MGYILNRNYSMFSTVFCKVPNLSLAKINGKVLVQYRMRQKDLSCKITFSLFRL